MSCASFVQTTITNLDTGLFNECRDVLIDEYLPLSLAQKEDLTVPVMAEKLCDYFEKIELKTGKPFEKVVENYTSDLDSVVGERIAKEPKPRKNKPTPPTPRARKYYEKACFLRKNNKETKHGLLDYTRIMLCLYAAIIQNNCKEIDDFNLSMNGLNLTKIIEALRKETVLLGKKPKFETKDPYTSDRSTFILLVIMFYYMKSKEIVGEY